MERSTPIRLSEELLVLSRLYPRESWPGANLSDLARFWLGRHALFRRLDEAIRGMTSHLAQEQQDPLRLRISFAHTLETFLGGLEEHHTVEDQHYFPRFRLGEPRLAAGFDLLDRDHDRLHGAMLDLAACSAKALAVADPQARAFRDAMAACHAAQIGLGEDLLQHLDDEEDLVVPLLLDRDGRAGG